MAELLVPAEEGPTTEGTGLTMEAPTWYAIRVVGARAAAPPAGLEGFRSTVSVAGGGTVTELVGEVPDQAALLRAIASLHAQRLRVLGIAYLPRPR